ncbi:DUF2795 domain-containing protein [Brevibacterium daeguense]|uniref:DUF2795 domain-containing protein n=1 Tax=Brevibacterium daeguense TaxID=909936 RepID=A0ABP8EHA1_9MICO|nr:DUF2795 domain-containing protein [Brevibacterium daeguense]
MAEKPNPIQAQKFLSGIDYPASRDDLVKKAEQSGADDKVMSALKGLEDRKYDSPADVSKGIGAEG